MSSPNATKVYTVREVARLLELSPSQIRSYARAGFLDPARGRRGEYRFSFQDLVLLRTARGLMRERVQPRKIRRALQRLREQLPHGRPLTGVQIRAAGDTIVVHDGETQWNPESGQACFNFEVSELARRIAPHARRKVAEAEVADADEEFTAEDWFDLGSELESAAPDHARDAYRRALEQDPQHADSHVNLGRLLHEARRLVAAEAHYRQALATRDDDAVCWFNLGVCLDDLGRPDGAIEAYLAAVASDPACADAHYNVARLYERAGDDARALQHLTAYRRLTREH